MSTGSSFSPHHEISDQVRSKFFIDGEWKAPSSSAKLDLISPNTEDFFLRVPEAAPADIDNAVEAARKAFDNGPWPRMSPLERSRYVAALGEELVRREPLLSRVWTAQVGAPVSFTGMYAPFIPTVYSYYASLGDTYPFVEDRALSAGYAEVRQEPVGVAAIIVP
jgi:acyl-CoA reductase-like NAD-dependent aldehyde dehydrogenase